MECGLGNQPTDRPMVQNSRRPRHHRGLLPEAAVRLDFSSAWRPLHGKKRPLSARAVWRLFSSSYDYYSPSSHDNRGIRAQGLPTFLQQYGKSIAAAENGAKASRYMTVVCCLHSQHSARDVGPILHRQERERESEICNAMRCNRSHRLMLRNG